MRTAFRRSISGRVSFERNASGAQLVVTNARPVHDPVVRLTLQAGCETAMRRDYVLLMDPPPIEAPLVAVDSTPPNEVAAPPAPPPDTVPPRASRAARAAPRDGAARVARETTEATRPARKSPPPRARAALRAAPKRAPVASSEARLTVSSAPPLPAGVRGKTTSEQERAQQELANAIEAETVVLRRRIDELTAMIDRMQQDVRAAEEAAKASGTDAANAPGAQVASLPAADDAKASAAVAKPLAAQATNTSPTPVPAPAWWEANWPLLAAIIGLPLLLAAALLWRRRQGAAVVSEWPAAGTSLSRLGPTSESSATSALRNPTAGLVDSGAAIDAPSPPPRKAPRRAPVARDGANALAVSELLHVTEEARVYVALGHPERAIDVLNEHIHSMPRSMPAAWLMLLDLYHAGGRRQEFRRLAEEFHLQCNVQTPLWEGFGNDEPSDGGLETFPHVLRQVVRLWRGPECREYLEGLLFDNREGRRIGFPLNAYSDILLLLQILDAPPAIDIDSDLVSHGKLPDAGGLPGGRRAGSVRRSSSCD